MLVDGELLDRVVTVGPDGQVAAIDAPDHAGDRSAVLDLGDIPLGPAPIDLHLHGCGGVAVPPAGARADLDAAIARTCAREAWSAPGTPGAGEPPYGYVATLPIPGTSVDAIVDHVAAAAGEVGGRCIGLRIEGLFLNPLRRGVWPANGLAAPSRGLLDEMVAACPSGALRIVDVAPELPGAPALIERAREHGLVVSLAHSDATVAEARAAIDAGATLATHTWNAMRPVHHREPGIVAAALTDARVTCELICDGQHLHDTTVALSVAAAGAGRIACVSDASPWAGSDPGTHEWAGVRVHGDGTRLVDDDGRLAGAAVLLTAAPRQLAAAGISLCDRVVALAATPLRVLDPQRPLGLAPGDRIWACGPGIVSPT